MMSGISLLLFLDMAMLGYHHYHSELQLDELKNFNPHPDDGKSLSPSIKPSAVQSLPRSTKMTEPV